MEPFGEVGVLMNLGSDGTRGEILKSLLTTSRMQKPDQVEVNILQEFQNNTQPEEQLVFQIEVTDPVKSEFLPNNESIIQHIPVRYLTESSSPSTPPNGGTLVEPVTYVLSRDVPRYCTVGADDAQKIILVQEVNANLYPETKVYAVKDDPTVWSVDGGGAASERHPKRASKAEEKSKKRSKSETGGGRSRHGKPKAEDSTGVNAKSEKRISSSKKQMNKRKNSKLKPKVKNVGKATLKKPVKPSEEEETAEGDEKVKRNLFELTKLEDNVDQVAERLKIGCECSDSNCFDGLNPNEVFKHRLNIADLTKAEHDMYLMGVIMASIHNLEETCRHKERIRIRSCYAYQGKKVCLTAFLYLQHVTLYQMKRLRSHLKNHGVSPRIHGNRGRKPANTLSLDIYRRATNFVQNYIEKNCVKTVPNFTTISSNRIGCQGTQDQTKPPNNTGKIANKVTSYHLSPDCTKRRVHREYKFFCENLKPSQKVMKYSTFTNFLKKQFPNVKFHKREEKKQEKATTGEARREWRTDHQEEGDKRPKEEQGVDKSIQVDKALVYIPTESQIVINGQLYNEGGDGGGANSQTSFSQVLVGSSQSQSTDQYYSIGGTV